MSGVERRRLCCAVLFHCAAGLCVIWSLCVLIERAAEEVRRGQIGWPFWTKLVVVTVGLTGGVVFMYIQCRQYLNLCNRWRSRNRILLIQNAPEKVHPPQSPPVPQFRRVRTAATSALPPVPLSACTNGSGPSDDDSRGRAFGPPLETDSMGHCELQINQHGQIIAANIESNSISYDRDWTLDDISQVSFKPCHQGSGSLTPMPFHDSVHNICDSSGGAGGVLAANHRYSTVSNSSNPSQPVDGQHHPHQHLHHHQQQQPQQQQPQQQLPPTHAAIEQSNASNGGPGGVKTADLHLFKLNNAELSRSSSPNVGAVAGRYTNAAIFLENRDILNDPAVTEQGGHVAPSYQGKLYHRHSAFMMEPIGFGGRNETSGDEDASYGGMQRPQSKDKSVRRYSDTKLLQKQALSFPGDPMPPCDPNTTKDQLLLNPKSIIYDMTSLLGPVIPVDPQDPNGATAGHAHHHHHHHRHHHHHHPHRHHRLQLQRSPDRDPESPQNTLQTTDIQFESGADDDPLELNIQEILEFDLQNLQNMQERRRTEQQRLSLENILQSSAYHDDPVAIPYRPYYDHHQHSASTAALVSSSRPRITVGSATQPATQHSMVNTNRSHATGHQQQQQQQQQSQQLQQQQQQQQQQLNNNNLKLFKSLPNLSASSENLLP